MRDRTQLDEAVTAIKRLEQDLEDAATLIELGEAEGDAATVAEGENGVRGVEYRLAEWAEWAV